MSIGFGRGGSHFQQAILENEAIAVAECAAIRAEFRVHVRSATRRAPSKPGMDHRARVEVLCAFVESATYDVRRAIRHNMQDELVTVAIFYTPMEADMAQSFLQSNGIETFLADEHVGRLGVPYAAVASGLKLQVHKSDEDVARELLDSVER